MPRSSTARSKARTTKATASRKTARKKASVSARAVKKSVKRPSTRSKTAPRPRKAGMLSKTTLRAKWIETVDQHADRSGQSLATRSHEVIQQWAEERRAQPATVPGSRYDDRPGVLRFDFEGFGGKGLEHISWDEWFKSFDERKLVFVYQEHLKNGNQSNFFRLDSPEREEA